MGQLKRIQISKLNQIVTCYSVSLASVQGMEQRHPIMRMPLGHGDRSIRRILKFLLKNFSQFYKFGTLCCVESFTVSLRANIIFPKWREFMMYHMSCVIVLTW